MTALSLLLLTDGRFPAGGYAHSGGLEPALADGLQTSELPRFLADRLAAISYPECLLMLAAARAARDADLPALALLDLEADARCPSPPLRTASRRLGAGLLRTASALWPDAAIIGGYRAASTRTPRPVAFGVVGAATGLDDSECASAYLYDEAMTIASAAVRLIPVDSSEALHHVTDAAPAIAALVEDAVSVRLPARELPSPFAPLHELRSLAHARREGRLFAS
jgi:urease accessory protein